MGSRDTILLLYSSSYYLVVIVGGGELGFWGLYWGFDGFLELWLGIGLCLGIGLRVVFG